MWRKKNINKYIVAWRLFFSRIFPSPLIWHQKSIVTPKASTSIFLNPFLSPHKFVKTILAFLSVRNNVNLAHPFLPFTNPIQSLNFEPFKNLTPSILRICSYSFVSFLTLPASPGSPSLDFSPMSPLASFMTLSAPPLLSLMSDFPWYLHLFS